MKEETSEHHTGMSSIWNTLFSSFIMDKQNTINDDGIPGDGDGSIISTGFLLLLLSILWLLYRMKQHLSIPLNALIDKYHSISIPHNPAKISLDYIDKTSFLIRWENQSISSSCSSFYSQDEENDSNRNGDVKKRDISGSGGGGGGIAVPIVTPTQSQKKKKKSTPIKSKKNVPSSNNSNGPSNNTDHIHNHSHGACCIDLNGSISHYLLYINNKLIGEFPNYPLMNNNNNNNEKINKRRNALYTSCSITNLKENHFYKIDLVSVNKNGFRNQPLSVVVNLNDLKNINEKTTTTTTTTTTTKMETKINDGDIVSNSGNTLHWKLPFDNNNNNNTEHSFGDGSNGNTSSIQPPATPSSSSSYGNFSTMHSLENFSLEQLKEILIKSQEELHSVIKYREELYQQYSTNEITITDSIAKNKRKLNNYQDLKKQQKAEISQLENLKNKIDFEKKKLNSRVTALKKELEKMNDKNLETSSKLKQINNTQTLGLIEQEKKALNDKKSTVQQNYQQVEKELTKILNVISDLKKKLKVNDIVDSSRKTESGNSTLDDDDDDDNDKEKGDSTDDEEGNREEGEEEDDDDEEEEEEEEEEEHDIQDIEEINLELFNGSVLQKSNGIINSTQAFIDLQKKTTTNHYNDILTKNNENKLSVQSMQNDISKLNEKSTLLNTELQKYTEYGISLTKQLIDIQQQHLKQSMIQQQHSLSSPLQVHNSPPQTSAPISIANSGSAPGGGTMNTRPLVLHDPNTYEDTMGMSQTRSRGNTNPYISYLMNTYQQQQSAPVPNLNEYTPLSTSSTSLLLDKNSLYGNKNSNLWNQQPQINPAALSQSHPLDVKSSFSSLSSMYYPSQQQSQQQNPLKTPPTEHAILPSSLSFYPMQASLSNSYSQSSLQPTSSSFNQQGHSSVWNDDSKGANNSPSPGQTSPNDDANQRSSIMVPLSSRFDLTNWNIPNR